MSFTQRLQRKIEERREGRSASVDAAAEAEARVRTRVAPLVEAVAALVGRLAEDPMFANGVCRPQPTFSMPELPGAGVGIPVRFYGRVGSFCFRLREGDELAFEILPGLELNRALACGRDSYTGVQMSLMLCWLASKAPSALPNKAKPEATAAPKTVSEEYSGPYATPEGASPFAVALDVATPEHLQRVRAVTGELGPDLCVRFWRSTGNPVWLLIAAGGVGRPSEIPAGAFAFLRSANRRILHEVEAQLGATDRVRVKPGEEMPDAVEAVAPRRGRPRATRPLPDLMALLGLSNPKRNLVQAIAANIRDASFAIVREDQARRTGKSREQVDHDLAQAFGMKVGDEVSEYAALGRAVKGRKLLAQPGRRGRPPKGSATARVDK